MRYNSCLRNRKADDRLQFFYRGAIVCRTFHDLLMKDRQEVAQGHDQQTFPQAAETDGKAAGDAFPPLEYIIRLGACETTIYTMLGS